MTTITLPCAVVEQALETLLKSHTCPLLPDDCEEAITALRAALAQQAEPVAKVELMMTGGNAGLATRIVEIDDHLRERLRPGQLLYTAPPQRKPLTDEEMEARCPYAKANPTLRGAFFDGWLNSERAHGIKE